MLFCHGLAAFETGSVLRVVAVKAKAGKLYSADGPGNACPDANHCVIGCTLPSKETKNDSTGLSIEKYTDNGNRCLAVPVAAELGGGFGKLSWRAIAE